MKLIFIAHPLNASTEEGIQANLARAIRWYKWCCDHYDHSFEATWMMNCQIYDDTNEEQRIRGIERALIALGRCDELWLVGGTASAGMRDEAIFMIDLDRPVYDLTFLGLEPPEKPYLGEMKRLHPLAYG